MNISAVAYPGAKVAFSESASFHGNGKPLDDPACGNVNAGFADGHVANVEPPDIDPSMRLETTPPGFWRPTRAVPFSSAAMGYLGRDY